MTTQSCGQFMINNRWISIDLQQNIVDVVSREGQQSLIDGSVQFLVGGVDGIVVAIDEVDTGGTFP
jgi:hypothetical protein